MAIYHLSVQIIKRTEGRSAVAAAAYRGRHQPYQRVGWNHLRLHKKRMCGTYRNSSAGVRTRKFQEASAPMESG